MSYILSAAETDRFNLRCRLAGLRPMTSSQARRMVASAGNRASALAYAVGKDPDEAKAKAEDNAKVLASIKGEAKDQTLEDAEVGYRQRCADMARKARQAEAEAEASAPPATN